MGATGRRQRVNLDWPYQMQKHPDDPDKLSSQEILERSLSPNAPYTRIGFGGPKGGGKAQPLDAKVMTPYGWRQMGDLKVGSKISNPDGTTQRVIQVHPQGEKDIYRVTFSDGASTEVCADHLWNCTISGSSGKSRGKKVTKWMVRDTRDLIHILDKNKGKTKWPLIPLTEPITYTKTYRVDPIKVDPYLLGVLLCDGGLTGNHNVTVTTPDPEIIKRIEGLGYSVTNLSSAEYGYMIVGEKGSQLRNDLRWLDLYGKGSHGKFIPEYYKYASVDQRKALVQGLMDTDGYVDDRGHMSYTSVSERLARDVQEVIWGLGGKATISIKHNEFGPVYTVFFNTRMNPELVWLDRKADRASYDFNGGISELTRRIVSIDFSRRAPAQCITVSNPNSLYITDNFIVTHNSYGARALAFTLTYSLAIVIIIVRSRLITLKRNHILPAKNELRDFLGEEIINYNEKDKIFYMPSGGMVQFMHCAKEGDIEQFDGVAGDVYIFEEAGHYTPSMIDGIIKNNRSSDIAINRKVKYKPRALFTFNWGGPGHQRMRRWFWDKIYEENEDKDDYFFIFASLSQNTALLDANPGYYKNLLGLPKQLREAYLTGDPDAFVGGMFQIIPQYHCVDPDKVMKQINPPEVDESSWRIPDTWRLVGSLDAGIGAPCAFGLYAINPEGDLFKLFTYKEIKGSAPAHVKAIMERIKTCKFTGGEMPEFIASDTYAFQIHNQMGLQSGDVTWEDLFSIEGVPLHQVKYKRVTAIMALQTAIHFELDEDNEELLVTPKLRFFDGYNNATIEEMRAIERSKSNPEDIDTTGDDHAIDETKNMVLCAESPPNYVPLKKTPKVNPKADYGSKVDPLERYSLNDQYASNKFRSLL